MLAAMKELDTEIAKEEQSSSTQERADQVEPSSNTLEKRQPDQALQKLIEGLVRTVASDGQLKVEESELLRTTCALLHCPMPILH